MAETTTFKAMAEKAAQAERMGEYRVAHDLWLQALPLAVKQENQVWAEARLQFCLAVR